ncbi:endochitinase 2 isoform X2 [Aphidius gifuensis]|uniref:endochitinase 2 isoform X2 n=1 Tax=Aphidius gifuensis TaxID=684658 RepID=UPI001CDCF166|nr:endochitinase 2 isoform X2 [Aphidius gifuensis]
MKCVYLAFVFLFIQVNAGVVKRPPAFAAPVYSDSYLPAAMQVIFHAVEQLKAIGKEEAELAATTTTTATTIIPTTIFPTTKIHEPGQVQPMPTVPSVVKPTIADSTTTLENEKPMLLEQTTQITLDKPTVADSTSTLNEITVKPTVADSPTTLENEKPIELEQTTQIIIKNNKTEMNKESFVTLTEKPAIFSELTTITANEKPELGGETPEIIYATPETNHETPETPEETNINQTLDEKTTVMSINNIEVTTLTQQLESESSESSESSEENNNDKKKVTPSIDSVVQEIYGIVKPKNKSKESSSSSSSEESKESKESKGSKKSKELKESNESKEFGGEQEDSYEDEKYDENRFNLLGEKLSQAPRPSLSAHLRKENIFEKCSLHKLALLYDSLSKDARKQGFAKYAGYSDEVLKTLANSSKGGISQQLQILLEKTIEKNNYTREDSKSKAKSILDELKNPTSDIHRDLARLMPLNFGV